jgi:WD40 repeat protein
VVCSGNLTESGKLKEFERAFAFLEMLGSHFELDLHRIMVVPGSRDVSRAACRAYFNNCEADEIEPQPPYWPKWRHFANLFGEFYRELDDIVFDSAQPWTLFAVRKLKVVVAGLNSTMAQSHRDADDYGWIGTAQSDWFATALRPFEQEGWLRLGVVHHRPRHGDPSGLRDADTVKRLLGNHLNLILPGAASAEGTAGKAADPSDAGASDPSGLFAPVMGSPGIPQLLEFAADGLTCWSGDDIATGPFRLERTWHAVSGIFPSAVRPPQTPILTSYSGTDEPTWVPKPRDELLNRIAQVCEARFERAKIQRVATEPAHLLITHLEDGFVQQFRVGAVVGELTWEDITLFLRHAHADGIDSRSEMVYLGPAPARALHNEARRRGVRLRSFAEFQGLLDLSGYVAAQDRRLASDPAYPPDLYVPQRFSEVDRPDRGVRDDLVGEMLDLLADDHGRFLLVLGDFGRGKTFAMREVARRISREIPHLVPVLIELRALDKAHSVDGLVAAHLANHGEELIDLKALHYMLKQGRIVLLFDGFDELVTRVSYERATDHLSTLLQASQENAKIVVASRTQHFRSHGQVLTALGERVSLLPQHRVLSIEDFTHAQIRTYLANRYHDEQQADDRMRQLSGIEDLLGLARNPRMLSFIADLDEDRLRAVAGAGVTVSAAGLYREILTSWLSFEEQRFRGPRGNPLGLTLDDLWRAVGTLAMRLWETDESYLSVAELAEVANTLTGLADGRLSREQTTHAVGAGSLLVRTEEGLFGFIHGSVVEWLVANRIADALNTGAPATAALTRRVLSQLTVDFLCDLADTRKCQEWAARMLEDPRTGDVARSNAIRITTRLRTPARSDLRGAHLRGEDLSHRDLQNVDLTGADLGDAHLVGVNLSGAILRNAILAGAQLDEAKLIGADLRGADLSRARLARADLRDAAIEGSRWTRAAVIDATPRDRLMRLPELADAAIAPGRPVDVQLAPPTIGVPYGFHFQTSRLPEPIAYSADGGTVAIGSEDGGVLICDAATGRPLRTLQGHRDRTYAVAYGPAGGPLVTGSADGTIRVWDTATGACQHSMQVHPEGVWPLVLSADGSLVAAGAADGILRIWNTTTGDPLAELPAHAAPIYTAAFGPGGDTLVTGDSGAVIRIWELSTGSVARTLSGHSGAIFRIRFSPDGALLAAGDGAGAVRLWDAVTGQIRRELLGHTGRVYALAFHPDGTLLATGDTEGSVRLWDVRTGATRQIFDDHSGAVYQAAFSPDGALLATADSDGAVRLWDPVTGQPRLELSGHRGAVWPFAVRPDGAQIATSSNDGTTRLWDTATGRCDYVLSGHGRRITSVRFSPGGSMLAASGNDGVVRVWEPRTGRLLRELIGAADQFTSAAFSPVGNHFATTSSDGAVHLWRSGIWTFERELNVETDHVWAQAFSPDGELLATANDDDTVRLWYHISGRQVADLADHRGRVRSIDFSPDGRLVATSCDDRIVRMWDTETAECLAALPGHTDRVYCVTFNADGTLLATASNDGTARIWDVRVLRNTWERESGRKLSEHEWAGCELHVISGHSGRLWTVDFNPGGTLLATAGDDLVVRLWDVRTGEHLHTLSGHARRIWSVAFDPGGSLLATASDDGTIILWDLTGDVPVRGITLLGMARGWAALAPDGRYKQEGDVAGQFWHAIAMCRFEPGELTPYLPTVRRVPLESPM